MFFPNFYLPEGLYKDEREVWDSLAKINSTGQNIDQKIYKFFKKTIDEILTHSDDSDYHPLDYPIVRYFLHPNSNYGVLNLPFIQSPEFIEQFIQEFGDELVNTFFREISKKILSLLKNSKGSS